MLRQLKIQKFRSWITKINSTLVDDVEDHEVLMAMCNLLKYSQNSSKTEGSFWKLCRTKVDYINDSSSNGKSFKQKKEKMENQKKAYMTSATTRKYSCISTNTTFKHKWHYSIQIS